MPSRPPRRGLRIGLAWLAVATMIALIWGFSSEGFSAEGTGRFLRPLIRWLWPEVSYRTLLQIHFWVRKAAHVTEYGVLALLAFRAIWLTFQSTALRVAAGSLLLVLLVAVADETRQATLPARTGSPWDVGLDTTGGLLALALLWLLQRAWRGGSDARSAPGAGENPSA